MSSTSRGYERHKTDYYVTPTHDIKDFLSAFLIDEDINKPDRLTWLDPCAGGDANNPNMPYADLINKEFCPRLMTTLDIRDDSLADTKCNYLTTPQPQHDVVITNPPSFMRESLSRKLCKKHLRVVT